MTTTTIGQDITHRHKNILQIWEVDYLLTLLKSFRIHLFLNQNVTVIFLINRH